MDEHEWLAERFEDHRPRLRAVAYRMLGSVSEADDAVQEAWLRVGRSDPGAIRDLGAWLTTIVSRISLNMLRTRRTRREQPFDSVVPDPIVEPAGAAAGPEEETLLAESVGLALLVVLETLSPAERLAFVLHDMFGLPFDDIAAILGRSEPATRQLASRARRRVRGQAPAPDADLARQREVVDAFFAASRDGDFEGLVAVLDPDVVLHADGGVRRPKLTEILHGARAVAGQAARFAHLAPFVRPALVNGAAGAVVAPRGRLFAVMGFTVVGGRIAEIDVLADPERLRRLDLDSLLLG
jgi:RNA polymerase sigma-70 factor (ECF subfamily)